MRTSMKIALGIIGGEDPNQPPITDNLLWRADAQQIEADANDPIEFFGGHGGSEKEPAVQETLAARPTFDPDVQGTGLPGLALDGSQWYLLPDGMRLQGSSPLTIYMVVTRTVRNLSAVWLSWRNVDPSNYAYNVQQITIGRIQGHLGGDYTGLSADDAWPNGRNVVTLEGQGAGNPYGMWVGEGQIHSRTTGSLILDTEDEPILFARDGASGVEVATEGFAHEVIVYTEHHDAEQRATIWAWLAERWSLTL